MAVRMFTVEELERRYGRAWVKEMYATVHKSHLEIDAGNTVTLDNLKDVLAAHGDPGPGEWWAGVQVPTTLNDLQTALIPLAKKAGVKARMTVDGTLWYQDADSVVWYMACENGTLRLEDVGLVEEWLAKAGYEFHGMETRAFDGVAFDVRKRDTTDWTNKFGDTLNEALAEAVKALPEEMEAKP